MEKPKHDEGDIDNLTIRRRKNNDRRKRRAQVVGTNDVGKIGQTSDQILPTSVRT